MVLVQVAVTSLVSLAAMFLLTKLMGNKQVSQMNLFDYVIGITVGSIAAEMATELDTPENSLVAMVVYAVAAVCISLWTNKSLGARRIITGKPLILMDGGVLYRENLKKAKMDLGDFLMYCRIGGYFDLGQIQTALLEHNGTVTFLPVEMQRPATPADLSMQPDQTLLQTSVIQDTAGESAADRKGRELACAAAGKAGVQGGRRGVFGYGGRKSGDGVSHGEQAGAGRPGR